MKAAKPNAKPSPTLVELAASAATIAPTPTTTAAQPIHDLPELGETTQLAFPISVFVTRCEPQTSENGSWKRYRGTHGRDVKMTLTVYAYRGADGAMATPR